MCDEVFDSLWVLHSYIHSSTAATSQVNTLIWSGDATTESQSAEK